MFVIFDFKWIDYILSGWIKWQVGETSYKFVIQVVALNFKTDQSSSFKKVNYKTLTKNSKFF